ncbi:MULTISPECIES: hypothetical protein [Olivibacter]|uniref:Uncharacterized protein n=1 Tax=Olivibacter oleidegradans TaxID=760123 RepID=A0ABV6HP39_9SPHI|nr:hypothetical protein [Olivibacter jilunii]MDX3914507.1 hypothetical protein [Pseudosphingobacterium sp.]
MNDSFEQLKNTWLSVDRDLVPGFTEVQDEIVHLRKQKRNRILVWYMLVILFSLVVIGYVIYTDKLNNIYKSISEFILLFTSIYLFSNSWKNITRQKKEYLLSNLAFIKSLSINESKRAGKQVLITCTCTSLFMISLFFHFLDDLLNSPEHFLMGLSSLLILMVIVWKVLKPISDKRISEENKELLSKTEKIFTNIND